tara:strand:- start:228 stop:410 length:183 start_codon:yes stop_codon:yes gene_type:complete
MHLSTNKRIAAMVFYSLLTFFITPTLTRPFFEDHPDPCMAGFILGGSISLLLWMKFSKDL